MAGVRLTADLDGIRAIAGLEAMRDMARHPGPLLRQIGVYAVHSTQARFGTGRDPHGTPWAPLNAAYAAVKRGPSILIGSGMSGGLQGSISSMVDGNAVRWGSNKVYAGIHQAGGVLVPKNARALAFRIGTSWVHAKSVRIPARPYLGLSAEDQEEIAWLAGRFAAKLLGAGR